MESRGRRYLTLDGIRGVAAMAVVMVHVEAFRAVLPPSSYTAVDLFFLMSGFVIAAAYEERISRDGIWRFIRARLIRLYPMLVVGLLLIPAFYVAFRIRSGEWLESPTEVAASTVLGLLFLPSRLASDGENLFPLDHPAWSLFFEMAANIAYALFLPWLSNRVLAGIVAISAGALVWLGLQGHGLSAGWGWDTFWWGFPRVGFSFFLGVLIYRLRITAPKVAPALVLLSVVLTLYAPSLVAVLICYPLIVAVAVQGDQQRAPIMAAMGALSYPLYVIHQPLLQIASRLFSAMKLTGWWTIPAILGLIGIASVACLKLWDEPLRACLSARRAKPQATATFGRT